MECDFQCNSACDNLPDVDFSVCTPNYSIGEIEGLIIGQCGYPFLDETDHSEWEARLELSALNPSRLIQLLVIGEKPESKQTEAKGAYDIRRWSNKEHQVKFEIAQVNAVNYEMMRTFERKPYCLAWYRTAGGKLYGGACGIESYVSMTHIIPPDRSEIEKITGTLTFYRRYHPIRGDMPELFSGLQPPLPTIWAWEDDQRIAWQDGQKMATETP